MPPVRRLTLLTLASLVLSSISIAQVPFETCGTIVAPPGWPFCTKVLQIDGGDYLVVTNYGTFQIGDRVHVVGTLQPCSTTCPTGVCMLGNTIEACAPCNCTSDCFGDGTSAPCPCGNNGATGSGCANGVDAGGGTLYVMGGASLAADTMVLRGAGMPNTPALYLQGTQHVDTPFGDGKSCVGGTIVRLGTRLNVNGASVLPAIGEPRLATVGMVGSPGMRRYQVLYRDPSSFCTGSTFNLSNGVEIAWGP